MSEPIEPGDWNAPTPITADWDTPEQRDEMMITTLRQLLPRDCVVVRRDDLETALYGSQYWGEELRQDGEQEALDRLRALIGDGHA